MAYEIGDYEFNVGDFFPRKLFGQITEVRVGSPNVVLEEAQIRRRRPQLTRDGKLTILACDHPARMVTRVGENPILMGSRYEYLGRILRVVTSPEFDGVMGTPDIIEELFIVNYLVKENGGESFLDEKVILGCMNRGGLAGTAFEMDDRFTAFTVDQILEMRLDGAKMMFRLDLDNPGSGKTIGYCADAITECAELGVPVFVEALAVEKTSTGYKTLKDADSMVKVVGVANGLGASSMHVWLKLSYCENYHLVAEATTLPVLMLGGEARGDPTPTLNEFAAGMRAGPSIRGALVGRNVHFPGKDDPLAMATAVHRIVHDGLDAEQAVAALMETRGQHMDRLSRWVR